VTIETGESSKGSVKTELRENAVGLPGMLMQGIATIGPSFAILASFVFIVGFAGIVTPWAFLFGGILVVWKSYFSPFTSTGPVFWGLMTFLVVLALTVVILIYLRISGQEDWMRRAQLVFEQTGGH
jgi:uncharacterized membrane protein